MVSERHIETPSRHRARQLQTTDGRTWVPKSGQSKFWVGYDTWIPSEQSLRIIDERNGNLIVGAPKDPQIMFSSPEEWVERK